MFKAEFELEAITPLFMRGADQRQAEIRAPSIKGLMRWWFRALAGNYFGRDIAGLKRFEERFFGGVGSKSRVTIEVTKVEGVKKSLVSESGGRCTINDKSPSSQLRYLWFSINLLAQNCRLKEYYPAGTKFNINIQSLDEKAFRLALASLWALVNLGSIGFRARRGAGCVRFSGGDLQEFDELDLRY